MEGEMRRHQAEMVLLFEELWHVSYAAMSWQYVTSLKFIALDATHDCWRKWQWQRAKYCLCWHSQCRHRSCSSRHPFGHCALGTPKSDAAAAQPAMYMQRTTSGAAGNGL
jgi:hypothetical protein